VGEWQMENICGLTGVTSPTAVILKRGQISPSSSGVLFLYPAVVPKEVRKTLGIFHTLVGILVLVI